MLQVELWFPEPQSLKEKRMILKSLVSRVRNKFNVAVAETDGMDLWQKSVLVIVSVAKDRKQANQVLDYVLDFVRAFHGVEIMKHELELL